MLKRISNLLKLAQIRETSLIVLASLFIFSFQATDVLAEAVNLNVEVKERKPTDTINDFNFSPVASVATTGMVLGAQSQRQANNDNDWKKIVIGILVYQIFCWLI